MDGNELVQDVEKLKQSLSFVPEPTTNHALVAVSGLPGTGKSYFCRKLWERLPFCILESDAMRKSLFPTPSYSAAESSRLFVACHRLMEGLLKEGVSIIFDATNLSERYRERLYRISDKTGARLVLVLVEAPVAVVYGRLQKRGESADPEDRSDADWNVYRRMKTTADRIQRNHFVVDTSRDIAPVIDKIVRLINH